MGDRLNHTFRYCFGAAPRVLLRALRENRDCLLRMNPVSPTKNHGLDSSVFEGELQASRLVENNALVPEK